MPESSIQLKSSQVFIVSRQQRIPNSVPLNTSFVRKTLEVKGFQTHPLCCLFRTCWATQTSPSLCAVRVTRHSCGFFSPFLKISVLMCDLQCLNDDCSVHHLQKPAILISFTLLLTEINQHPDWLKHLAASHCAWSLHCQPVRTPEMQGSD